VSGPRSPIWNPGWMPATVDSRTHGND
jgi:hypothetical protein